MPSAGPFSCEFIPGLGLGAPALGLSWALLLGAAEVVLAHSPGSALASGLGLVGVLSVSAIVSGLDFFGVTLLAAYSSVFLLLTLVLLHTGRAWSFFAPAHRGAWVGLLALAYPLYWAPAGGLIAGPAHADHYLGLGRGQASPVGVVHSLLVSVGAWEATLANLYILVGLATGISFLGLQGPSLGRGNPATPLRARRSWRRRHSTQSR